MVRMLGVRLPMVRHLMRLHVIGLPHTEVTERFLTCAYTQKVLKFGQMMTEHGIPTVIYAAGDETEAICDEYVPVLSTDERLSIFGPEADDPNGTWAHVTWDPAHESWQKLNTRAVEAINERAEPGDLVLLASGGAQRSIAERLTHLVSCEPFVGYEGIALPFCAFESQAWRHHVYGRTGINDGRWYDTVIPNYFNPDDFHVETRKDNPPYLLYIGRLIYRKGILTANQVAKAADIELKVAGPGAASYKDRTLITTDNCVLDDVDYLGPLDPIARADAMARATAVIAPTTYIEPFGGVTVEAMFSGTPAITTQWGVYPETVREGISGCRFDTLKGGVEAIGKAAALKPQEIRQYALENYSLKAVAPQFADWFARLNGLYGEGWTDLT